MSYPKPPIEVLLGDAFLVCDLRKHAPWGKYVIDGGNLGTRGDDLWLARLTDIGDEDTPRLALHDFVTGLSEPIAEDDERTCWEYRGLRESPRADLTDRARKAEALVTAARNYVDNMRPSWDSADLRDILRGKNPESAEG